MIDRFDGEYRWLSNFYPAPVEWEGRKFPTVEHAYQAAKAAFPADADVIAGLPTAGKAKRAGKKLESQGRIRVDWLDVRVGVMRALLEQKFALGTELSTRLQATGQHPIAEGNSWHDNFWGSCGCGKCPDGQNILGNLLMEIRASLDESPQ